MVGFFFFLSFFPLSPSPISYGICSLPLTGCSWAPAVATSPLGFRSRLSGDHGPLPYEELKAWARFTIGVVVVCPVAFPRRVLSLAVPLSICLGLSMLLPLQLQSTPHHGKAVVWCWLKLTFSAILGFHLKPLLQPPADMAITVSIVKERPANSTCIADWPCPTG